MKKVAAFTIAELLVVSVLSLLIASAAFSVIRIFNQQYSTYQEDLEAAAELDELDARLKWDSYNATKMVIKNGNLHFEYPRETIQYQLNSKGITRRILESNLVLKKFKIKYNNINTFLKNEHRATGRIDNAQLSIQLFDREISILITKVYSAKSFITDNGN